MNEKSKTGGCRRVGKMKFEFEPDDIETIAEKVTGKIIPLLSRIEGHSEGDTIFDVEGLAKYLVVEVSWVYKQVSLRTIPFFKTGKYIRFSKRKIDKWIESRMVRPVPTLGFAK